MKECNLNGFVGIACKASDECHYLEQLQAEKDDSNKMLKYVGTIIGAQGCCKRSELLLEIGSKITPGFNIKWKDVRRGYLTNIHEHSCNNGRTLGTKGIFIDSDRNVECLDCGSTTVVVDRNQYR